MAKARRTTRAAVKAALRRLWMMSPERYSELKKTGHRCASCGVKSTKAGPKENHVVLNVHHKAKINWDFLDIILDRLFYSEQIALCKRCHYDAHNRIDDK